jgi:hypothetical protein
MRGMTVVVVAQWYAVGAEVLHVAIKRDMSWDTLDGLTIVASAISCRSVVCIVGDCLQQWMTYRT